MEQKEVKIGEKLFKIHELLAIEFDDIMKLNENERVVGLVKKSADLSDEEYSKLTIKERSKIMTEVNKINGWSEEDFQQSETAEKE